MPSWKLPAWKTPGPLKLLGAWLSPFKTISAELGSFLVWIVTAIGIAGAGIWLIPLLRPEMSAGQAYLAAVTGGALGTFCIALIGEGVSTNIIQAYRRRPWEDVEGGRAFAAVVGLFILIAQTLVMGNLSRPREVAEKYISVQIILAVLAVLLAVYLHCFRLEQEASVTRRLKTEEDEVQNIVSRARKTESTSAGEKL
jgi:Na+/melibiose symporter-like transporter